MKLCIVTHCLTKGDGQGRVNYEIAWEAIRCGHHLTLLSSSVDSELQNHSQVEWIYIPVQKLPTVFLRNILFSWQTANWLRHHRSNLDIVIVNGAITATPGDVNAVHFVHSSWLKSPVHTWQQRRDLYGLYQLFYSTLNAYWEKKAFRQAKVVVAVSQKVAQDLIEIGVAPESIEVIVNGVDLQEFCPGKTDRIKLGLPEEVTLALVVGDIQTPRKNLDTVLYALLQVPNLHLVVVGTIAGSPYLDLAAKLGLRERVHFLGYRPDVAEIMRGVDFFIFPSRYEACTLVLLEAMASGLPIITAATTGGAEIVTSDSGFVLPNSEDMETLVQTITKLIDDRELRCKMGQAARAIAQQHSWARMARHYVDLCEKLNNSGKSQNSYPIFQ